MSDKKHIDRLFQEKLKDFEVAPQDIVWDRIHSRLHNDDEQDRKVIPLWWKLAGVAAIIALLLTVGITFFSDGSTATNTVVDVEEKSSNNTENSFDSNSGNPSQDLQNKIDDASTIANEDNFNQENSSNDSFDKQKSTNSSKTNYPYRNKSNASNSNNDGIVGNYKSSSKDYDSSNGVKQNNVLLNKTKSTSNAVTDVSGRNKSNNENPENQLEKQKSEIDKLINNSKNNSNTAITDATNENELEDGIEELLNQIEKGNSIEDAIADATTENEEEKKLNRWNISPNVAPVYFNSLGKGSSLDEQFVNNQKDGEVTMSYGVGGSYAINDRLKVRAGINKVSFGYNTNNVIAFAKVEPSTSFAAAGESNDRIHLSNVNTNSGSENITFLSSETFNRNITPEVINSKSNGSLNQRFGFIEIPMEVEYAVLNKKFAVNVIGGFSTFIVDENEIYSVFDGSKTKIGEANNINNMSYSANFGLGINYNVSEKIKVNVEPTFKYQINTFSNSSGDFQPYFIGVYTGLSYKF